MVLVCQIIGKDYVIKGSLWEPLMVSHHTTKSESQRYCCSEDMFLVAEGQDSACPQVHDMIKSHTRKFTIKNNDKNICQCVQLITLILVTPFFHAK